MVGKLHKKKISEYTAENEDYKSDIEGVDDDIVDKEDRGSGSESENGDVAKNDINKSYGSVGIRDDDEETTLGEDDERAHGLNDSHDEGDDGDAGPTDDYGDDYDDDNAKKTKKRKATAKKDDNETDDEALNGVTPKKKGRKPAAGKAAAKGSASKAKAKPKKAAPVDDDEEEDDEGEEEYEVKDIVGHKTERGVSYFQIRWKGYTKADDTWEAEDTLNCPEIIDKYKKKQLAITPKKGATPASKKGKASTTAAAAKGNKNKKQEVEQEWEVDKIIDYAEEKKGRIFRIRWKGFGPKHDTWEPEENLHCGDIIEKFMKRMKSEENLSFKELREQPKKTKRLVNETAPRTNILNPIGRKSKRGGNKKSTNSTDRLPSPNVDIPQEPAAQLYSTLSKDNKAALRLNGLKASASNPLAGGSLMAFGADGEYASFLNHVDWVLKKLPDMSVEKMQARIFAMLYDELGRHTPKRKGA